jgi:hypothetical protein
MYSTRPNSRMRILLSNEHINRGRNIPPAIHMDGAYQVISFVISKHVSYTPPTCFCLLGLFRCPKSARRPEALPSNRRFNHEDRGACQDTAGQTSGSFDASTGLHQNFSSFNVTTSAASLQHLGIEMRSRTGPFKLKLQGRLFLEIKTIKPHFVSDQRR